MANLNYQRGAYLERKVAEDLWRRGFEVIRAAGSKGAADVWASRVVDDERGRKIDLVLVQAKSGKAKAGPAERAALVQAAAAAGGRAILASRPPRYRAIMYAECMPDGSRAPGSLGDLIFGEKIRELPPKKIGARAKRGAEDQEDARPTD